LSAVVGQDRDRARVLLIYDNDPSWTPEERKSVDRDCRGLGFALRRQGHSVVILPLASRDLAAALSDYKPEDVLVFNWCESLPGVDHSEATVVEILEKLSFTYTGATAASLRQSYDKVRAKRVLQARGIPTPVWTTFSGPADDSWRIFPAIVKPACEHCSIGVDAGAVVGDLAELRARVAYVVKTFRQPALVEDFIDGPEYHVPLWGNKPVEMLSPVEMDFSAFNDLHNHICSYDSKFDPKSVAYRKIKSYVPARLTKKEMGRLEAVSRAAYQALDCRDYGRVDVRRRGKDFYVLDVNPNADISANASMALAASRAGYCFGAMGSRIVQFAGQRRRRNKTSRKLPLTDI
jgi:D-alanine-D-alanine ligase